jgi:predicted RNase H-like HicB family nuclease
MWSEEDRAFIARVKEFPGIEAHGESRGSSIRALRSVIATVVKDLVECGEEVPAIASLKKSGDDESADGKIKAGDTVRALASEHKAGGRKRVP